MDMHMNPLEYICSCSGTFPINKTSGLSIGLLIKNKYLNYIFCGKSKLQSFIKTNTYKVHYDRGFLRFPQSKYASTGDRY